MKTLLVPVLACWLLAGCHRQAGPSTPPTQPVEPAPRVTQMEKPMVGILTRFKVLPGKDEAAFALLRDTASQVQATEPGTLIYTFFKNKNDPQEIIVFEIFTSADARTAHSKGPVLAAVRPKLPEVIDMTTFKVELLDEVVAGFAR